MFKRLFRSYIGLPKEIYIIAISKFVNAMGAFIFPLMTLILKRKIGLDSDAIGVIVSIFGITYLPAALIGGKLTDSIGRKKIIVIFDSLGSLCYIICSFIEPSMITVYLIGLASFIFGFAGPAHDSLIADLTTTQNREASYSLGYLGFNMGFAIGPALGGLLFENHLAFLFIGDGVTILLATMMIAIFIKEEAIHHEEQSTNTLEEEVEGSVFKVLKERPVLLYYALISFGFTFVYSQWGFLTPLHTEAIYKEQGPKIYGYLSSFNGITVMLTTTIITNFLIRINVKNIYKIAVGGLLYGLGLGILGFSDSIVSFFIAIGIFTIGEVVVAISSAPFIMNHTPASHRGRMNSIIPLIIGAGHVTGPLITGKVIKHVAIPTVWKYVLLICTFYALLMFILGLNEERLNGKNGVE